MIRAERAVTGGKGISWNGSLSQGQAMVKREKKPMLRAFNGECDSFVSDVEWNNVVRMEERIEKSFDAVNKIYEKQGISMSYAYKSLKLKELHLAYEYKRKKYEEKEEQRAIREQMRDEEKAQREIEAALMKAQKEEETYQKALDKARTEVQTAQGAAQSKLEAKIAELEARVADVYKIGMTRRLDPMDRVKELGDASVPFPFDVHAMIFCEDVPALENTLHKKFDRMRLNLVNQRKEFFKVTLDEIEEAAHENGATIEFTKIAEARDFRESQAARSGQKPEQTQESIPVELFASLHRQIEARSTDSLPIEDVAELLQFGLVHVVTFLDRISRQVLSHSNAVVLLHRTYAPETRHPRGLFRRRRNPAARFKCKYFAACFLAEMNAGDPLAARLRYLRRESNPDLRFRKPPFYPLNYKGLRIFDSSLEDEATSLLPRSPSAPTAGLGTPR